MLVSVRLLYAWIIGVMSFFFVYCKTVQHQLCHFSIAYIKYENVINVFGKVLIYTCSNSATHMTFSVICMATIPIHAHTRVYSSMALYFQQHLSILVHPITKRNAIDDRCRYGLNILHAEFIACSMVEHFSWFRLLNDDSFFFFFQYYILYVIHLFSL